MPDFETRVIVLEENAMMKMMDISLLKAIEQARPVFYHTEEVMTTEEAASFCKVSVSTFSTWMRNGLITPHRPTGGPRFLKSELIDFIKRN
jgi:excisionase family DNA binding protein